MWPHPQTLAQRVLCTHLCLIYKYIYRTKKNCVRKHILYIFYIYFICINVLQRLLVGSGVENWAWNEVLCYIEIRRDNIEAKER